MRKIIAVWAAKLAAALSKLLGKNGSTIPGRVALKICPDILSRMSGDIDKGIIAVWGTNGKTTTCVQRCRLEYACRCCRRFCVVQYIIR